MPKRILMIAAGSLALAGLGNAEAVSLSPKGSGQALIYPYYTVNAINNTLFSLVNGSDRGKAVKLRFREGMNARVVADLNVYLAPFDVWTSALFGLSEDGAANLLTDDNSCTVPAVKGNTTLPRLPDGRRYLPFSNFGYAFSNNDAGPEDLLRTREGFIEVIEMGEITNASTHKTLDAITHTSNGVPAACTQLREAWNAASGDPASAYWALQDSSIDSAPPGGGLFGSGLMVDVINGRLMAYNATALDAFSASIQHTGPGAALPDLASANTTPDRADALVFDAQGAPVVSSYPIDRAIDAVSAVLSAERLFNEFVTLDGGAAQSEWVLTFPTRHYYVDPAIIGDGPAIPPFTRPFRLSNFEVDAGTDYEATVFDREAGSVIFVCDPSECLPFPVPPPPSPQFSWSSNVLTINQSSALVPSSIFGSRLTTDIDAAGIGVRTGSLRLDLYRSEPQFVDSRIEQHISRPDLAGNSLFGLPVVGFWAVSFTNGAATPGVLANYTAATPHRWTSRYQSAVSP